MFVVQKVDFDKTYSVEMKSLKWFSVHAKNAKQIMDF